MRKNYALLKRYTIALTLLLTATIIIYSCKKDNAFSNPETIKAKLLSWYQNHRSNQQDTTNLFGTLKPNYSQTLLTVVNEQNIVEISLVNNNKIVTSISTLKKNTILKAQKRIPVYCCLMI